MNFSVCAYVCRRRSYSAWLYRKRQIERRLSGRTVFEVLARFYEKEDAQASRLQVVIERVSSFFGSPGYFAGATIFILLWIAANTWGDFHHWLYLKQIRGSLRMRLKLSAGSLHERTHARSLRRVDFHGRLSA
jgi:hypothetical protein